MAVLLAGYQYEIQFKLAQKHAKADELSEDIEIILFNIATNWLFASNCSTSTTSYCKGHCTKSRVAIHREITVDDSLKV